MNTVEFNLNGESFIIRTAEHGKIDFILGETKVTNIRYFDLKMICLELLRLINENPEDFFAQEDLDLWARTHGYIKFHGE